jgi:hypothetical protein
MRNPYKELVKELAERAPFISTRLETGLIDEYCFYCQKTYNPFHSRDTAHRPLCLYFKAKTFLDQNPDIKEDNHWISCSDSEGLPKEDGVYIVTTKKRNIFYDEPFRNGEWWRFDKGDQGG